MQGSTKYDFINRSADASRNPEAVEEKEDARQQNSVESAALTYLGLFVGFAVAVALIALIALAFKFGTGQSSEIENWALTGDFIGGVVGTALSFGTLAVVLFALMFQVQITQITSDTLNEAEKARTAAESQAQSATQMVEDARVSAQSQLDEQKRQLVLSAIIQFIDQRSSITRGLARTDRRGEVATTGPRALEHEMQELISKAIKRIEDAEREIAQKPLDDLADMKFMFSVSNYRNDIHQICLSVLSVIDFLESSGIKSDDPISQVYKTSISWGELLALKTYLLATSDYTIASKAIDWVDSAKMVSSNKNTENLILSLRRACLVKV